MFLALKEMRRAKVRFALLMAAVGLLVFLVLFLNTIQNALITSFIGAIRNNSAPVFVYSVDSRRNLQGGVLLPELEQKARTAPGVGRSGRIGQGTFTVTTRTGEQDAAILGYEVEGLGSPSSLSAGRFPSGPNEAVASEADADKGFAIGDTVTVVPGGMPITVVGQARDAQLSVSPTLFVTYDTYLGAVKSRNPTAGTPLPSALGVAPAEGVSAEQVAAGINAASPQLDALPRAEAAAKAPGVSQVQLSFRIIFVLLTIVVPFVTGLFFLILTLQKANSLTLLRAVGAPARRLVNALLLQVVAVVGVGLLIGIGIYAALVSRGSTGGVTLRFEGGTVLFWAVLLGAASLVSALFSARRVLAIDPVAATTGAGVGR